MSMPMITLASDVVACTGMSLSSLSVALAGGFSNVALATTVGIDAIPKKRRAVIAAPEVVIRHDGTTSPKRGTVRSR
jgi:hypothetical protein